MSRAYLAGPMSGYPEYNFPAFHSAAADLRAQGWEVWNPAEKDEADGFNPKLDKAEPLREYMKKDLPAVLDSDYVIVLPGWEKSKGASIEVHVARELGIPVLRYPDLMRIPQPNILETANELIHGDRNAAYGHPYDDFSGTAGALTALGFSRDGRDVLPGDVPDIQIVVKLSRRRTSPLKLDHLVDIAGYAGTAEMVLEREDGIRPETTQEAPGA